VDPPTFTASGVPTADGSWSVGSLTVDADNHAHLTVTTGATVGTVFWVDTSTRAVVVTDVSAGDNPPYPLMKAGRLPRSGLPRWYVRRR
jgi:hypothetical protein